MTLPTLETQNGARSRTGAFDFESAPAFLLNAGRAVALVAICLAPWWFGCVRITEKVPLYLAILVAALTGLTATLIRAFRTANSGSLRVPLLLIPMIAGIGLGAAQLLPGENELTTSRVEQSKELAQWDLGPPIKSTRNSFYPHYTMLELARYTFATLAFLVGYTLFRSPGSQRFLWAAVTINGVVLVIFGLIQKFNWNGKLFWNVVLSNGGDPFASFVNRNNAMAFVGVTIAGALGLLVWAVDRRPIRATKNALSGLAARIAAIDALQVILLIALAVLGGGAVASASRSGVLSIGIGLLVVLTFLAIGRRSGAPFVIAIGVIAVAATFVLTLQVQDRLATRIAKVDVEKLDQRTRIKHGRDAINVTKALPLLGAGLGTHRYAYTPFVSEFGRLWAVNADNQYVELAVEAGLIGLGLLAVFLMFATRLFWVGRASGIESSGTAVAVLFLICSQVVHAVFDFGIILPATLMTACLMLGTAASSISARTGGSGASIWAGRFSLPAILLALCALSVGCLGVCRAEARSYRALVKTKGIEQLSDEQLDSSITEMKNLAGAEVCQRRAELLMERYERQARAEVRSQAPQLPDEQVRFYASLETLHVTVQRLRREGRSQDEEEVRTSKQVATNLVPALESLHEAIRRCPILPDTFASISRIEAILKDNADDRYAKRAILLEPYNDRAAAKVGFDLMQTTSFRPMGASMIRHGLGTVRWRVQGDVLDKLANRFGLEKVLAEVCPRDGFAAARLAGTVRRNKSLRHLDVAMLKIGLAAEAGNSSLDSLLAQAAIHWRLGDKHESVELHKKAIERYPGDAEAHFRYAEALKDSGDLAAALVEARIAVGLDSDEPDYTSLLNKLTSRVTGEVEPSRAAKSQGGSS